ncbi:MAG TPA: hypothetical protein VF461_13120 [Gemmatimonadaceae bacterium]
MPSDERSMRAYQALADRMAAFRAGVTSARDEMRDMIASHRGVERYLTQSAALALGAFASGRIDTQRFGTLLADQRALAPDAADTLVKCVEALDELLAYGDALFVRHVPRGGLLRDEVDARFAEVGRAFAAARVFQTVRRGAPMPPEHLAMLRQFPFAQWSRAERDLAPPLMIRLDGADLRAEHLAEYLDGAVRIALVVDAAASPVPLVRLIAPNVLVLQTSDATALDALNRATGPAVAALLPEGCAEWLHDPRGGARLDERLTITRAAANTKCEPLGWRSARQARDEIAQLDALAELCRAARDVSLVVVPPLGGAGQNGEGSVDAVAEWLLAQAGFDGGAG